MRWVPRPYTRSQSEWVSIDFPDSEKWWDDAVRDRQALTKDDRNSWAA